MYSTLSKMMTYTRLCCVGSVFTVRRRREEEEEEQQERRGGGGGGGGAAGEKRRRSSSRREEEQETDSCTISKQRQGPSQGKLSQGAKLKKLPGGAVLIISQPARLNPSPGALSSKWMKSPRTVFWLHSQTLQLEEEI
ncbi:hypothetical protein PFLUV_G00109690 [Perca fluviatilis]|uniref:Uncharacterized protein n=1 Tax=Perca fluviatilis TaxID=8168 RepID=A0A6A5EXU9_PERFL|nr:hypothetical protein PFLUV_G00109690 [Perca fluviatilis]